MLMKKYINYLTTCIAVIAISVWSSGCALLKDGETISWEKVDTACSVIQIAAQTSTYAVCIKNKDLPPIFKAIGEGLIIVSGSANEDNIKRSTSTVWVRPDGIEHEAFISDSLFAGDGVHRVEIERMASNINGEIKEDCLITSTGDYPIDLTSRFFGDFESKHKCFVEKDVQLDSPRVSLKDILHQGFPDMDGYSGFSSCESSNYRQLFSEHEANIERAKALYTMLPTNKKTSSIVR